MLRSLFKKYAVKAALARRGGRGGREVGREGWEEGALTLETLVLQMKFFEWVYQLYLILIIYPFKDGMTCCESMTINSALRCVVILFDRWRT